MASRDMQDLRSDIRHRAEEFIGLAEDEGIDILIYCTMRSADEQARLYRQHRTYRDILRKADQLRTEGFAMAAATLLAVGPQHGDKIKTGAAPWQSPHQYGLAFDFVPTANGKLLWDGDDPRTPEDDKLWARCGELLEQAGLEWGAHFSIVDRPHAQSPGFDWRECAAEWEARNKIT